MNLQAEPGSIALHVSLITVRNELEDVCEVAPVIAVELQQVLLLRVTEAILDRVIVNILFSHTTIYGAANKGVRSEQCDGRTHCPIPKIIVQFLAVHALEPPDVVFAASRLIVNFALALIAEYTVNLPQSMPSVIAGTC